MISRSESRSPSISAASSAPVRSSRGLPPARRDHLGEVLEHPQRRLRGRGRQAAHALVAVHHLSAQAAQHRPVRRRHAEQLADHVHRELAGEVAR